MRREAHAPERPFSHCTKTRYAEGFGWGRIDDGRGRRVDQSLPAMRQRGVSRAARLFLPALADRGMSLLHLRLLAQSARVQAPRQRFCLGEDSRGGSRAAESEK